MRISSYKEFRKKKFALNIKSEKLSNAVDNGGRSYIRLSLEAAPGDDYVNISDINFVEYELPPTFTPSIYVSKEPNGGFEIKVWALSGFNVRCSVYMRSGGIEYIESNITF